VAGIAAWVSLEGRTYQLITYAPENVVASQESVFQQIIRSFGPLRDQAALNVQANRLNLVAIPDRMTLSDFNRRYPSVVNLNELAVINDVASPSAPLAPGTLVKRVVGTARR